MSIYRLYVFFFCSRTPSVTDVESVQVESADAKFSKIDLHLDITAPEQSLPEKATSLHILVRNHFKIYFISINILVRYNNDKGEAVVVEHTLDYLKVTGSSTISEWW